MSTIILKKYENFFQDNHYCHFKLIEDENENAYNEKLKRFKNNNILIFLIDKSGSMSGSPFNLLTQSIFKLVPLVNDTFEKIHYIIFDTNAREINFEELKQITASGGTEFDNAHLKMIELIDKYPDGFSFQIVYFTDGGSTVNFKILNDFLLRSDKKSKTFHTIGFGSHNHDLLTKLTQLSSTTGTYKYISSSTEINFDDFSLIFNSIKTGYILFNNEKKFFILNQNNEEDLFIKNFNHESVENVF